VNGTTITQVTKVTESVVIVPSTSAETATTENGSSTEITPAGSEAIITTTTTTTEEIIKTITPVVEAESTGAVTAVAAEEAAPVDGMDTSE
jgi:hypothetical protein